MTAEMSEAEWLYSIRVLGAKLAGKANSEAVSIADQIFGGLGTTELLRKDVENHAFFARGWAECGFPQIIIDDSLFASLALTSIPSELVPRAGLPWNYFIVRIPTAFQPVVPELGPRPVAYMQVCPARTPDGGLGPLLLLKPIDMKAAATCGLNALADALVEHDDILLFDHGKTVAFDDSATLLLRRVFVGAILELDRSGCISSSVRPTGRDGRGVPKAWTFRLTRAVRIDCRAALSDAIHGHGKAPTIQTLVRGHWKNQVHGPRATQRKLIHVEPYWRGPEDAPIAVRPHTLKNT